MDEFLCEVKEEYADQVGALMCESYKYASDACYDWHKDNIDMFPNSNIVSFAFDLDGGYKVSDLGGKGNYLQTH